MEVNPKDKVKCICFQYISHRGMERHLQYQSHISRLTPKLIDGISQIKLNESYTFKDECNCCCKCYRTLIYILTTLLTLVRHVMRLLLTKINYANIVIQLKILHYLRDHI